MQRFGSCLTSVQWEGTAGYDEESAVIKTRFLVDRM